MSAASAKSTSCTQFIAERSTLSFLRTLNGRDGGAEDDDKERSSRAHNEKSPRATLKLGNDLLKWSFN